MLRVLSSSANLSLFHLQRCEQSFLDSQLRDILQVLFSEKYYIGLHLSISKRLSHAGVNLPQKYFSSFICSMLLLKSVLIRFFYFDFLMRGFSRRCNYDQAEYQRLCHLIYLWLPARQQAGKKHSLVFKTLYPFISKP